MSFAPLIDTHCHLTEPLYLNELAALLTRLRSAGIERIIAPAFSRDSCSQVIQLKKSYDHVAISLGIHPQFIPDDLTFLEKLIPAEKPVAVGEIGLDYRIDTPDRRIQQKACRTQLEWASGLKLPVIIHCVRAHPDMIRLLEAFPGLTGVIHRVSCSQEVARSYLDAGFHFGFGPEICNDGYKNIRSLAQYTPADRILLETDCPFTYWPDHRIFRPEELVEVLLKLAEMRGEDAAGLSRVIRENTNKVFNFNKLETS
jgi:TatD DNase family protein